MTGTYCGQLFALGAIGIGCWLVPVAWAETTETEELTECGAIVTPENFYYEGSEVWYDDILNCDNPFEVTGMLDTFSVNGEIVVDHGSYVVGSNGTNQYGLENGDDADYYRHDNGNYVRVDGNLQPPTDAEILRVIREFFNGDESLALWYNHIYHDTDQWQYFYDWDLEVYIHDARLDRLVMDVYNDVEAYVDTHAVLEKKPLLPGTYTVVTTSGGGIPTQTLHHNSWWTEMIHMIIPVAYAAIEIKAVTFTLLATAPEPTGASSVLFLPGIMGSHLYEQGQQCGDFGEEQQRWFSKSECEQLRLSLNETGNSINDIYTKSDEEGIFASVDVIVSEFASNYSAFMETMNELEGDTIAEFRPFPYDWRLSLEQLLQLQENEDGEVRPVSGIPYTDGLLYTTLTELADESYSGHVTIVAHSNGGLLAKAFLQKLTESNDPLLEKIDNLILVGSPQVGTPDAIVSMLHGSELVSGWVAKAETTRQILNNAPMAYHLLPNEHYFAGEGVSADVPVIVFDQGIATAPYIEQFGTEISTVPDFVQYAGQSSGRTKPDVNDLYAPEVANDRLLSYAESIGDVLATWTPPDTMNIYQLAGIGMWTAKTLHYFSGEECVRRSWYYFGCDQYEAKLLHDTYFTREGDGTVVLPSALAMTENEQVERWWLDLEKYQKEITKQVHKDMMEIPDVANFVTAIAAGTTSSSRYIVDEAPDFTDVHTLVYKLHSPLDMHVVSDIGTVSSSTNTIVGASYRRSGETQYIFLPPETPGAVLHLTGYEAGSFTLVEEQWFGEEKISSLDYRAIPTGTSTKITLVIGGENRLIVDYNDDGLIDGMVSATDDIPQLVMTPPGAIPEPSARDENKKSGTRVRERTVPVGEVAGIAMTDEVFQLTQILILLQELIKLLNEINHIKHE